LRTLFDTSVVIALRDGDPLIKQRAGRLSSVALLSILSVVELEGGMGLPVVDKHKRRAALDAMYELLDVLPFGVPEAAAYSRIVDVLGFSRSKVIDRMIAAQALVSNARLATLNPRDFRNIPGLTLEDWSV